MNCSVCGSDNAANSVACGVCFAPLAVKAAFSIKEFVDAFPPADMSAEVSNAEPCGFPLHLETERGTIPDVFKQDELPGIEPAPLVPESVKLVSNVPTYNGPEGYFAPPAAQLPLLDETPTDWYDGRVLPHYIGWYDVQMVSRLHESPTPAPGITRFWFAGRDWYTGPRAKEMDAPCVPIGKIYAWRGRAKP